jgi:hypothetical protein
MPTPGFEHACAQNRSTCAKAIVTPPNGGLDLGGDTALA